MSDHLEEPTVECQALRDKRLIRQILMQQRVSLSPQLVSHSSGLICRSIEDFVLRREFSRVLMFSAIRGEPDLTPLAHLQQLAEKPFSFALPRVQTKKEMSFYSWQPGDELLRSSLGILEPNPRTASPIIPDKRSLILVPALAVDPSGNRLGYGGGFYDRYLARYRDAATMAVVWGDLVQDEALPTNSWDIKVQSLVTEDGIVEY